MASGGGCRLQASRLLAVVLPATDGRKRYAFPLLDWYYAPKSTSIDASEAGRVLPRHFPLSATS